MVQLKKKVTIKTKMAEEETPAAVEKPVVTTAQPKVSEKPVNPPTPPTGGEEGGESKSKAWIWIIVLLVIAAIAFFGYKSCSKTDNAATDADTTAVDTTDKAKADTLATDTVAQQKGTPSGESSDQEADNKDEGNGTTAVGNGGSNSTPTANTSEPKQTPTTATESKQMPTASAPVSGSVEENAHRVIRGDFGNGKERKDKLGSSYSEIQNRVNEMYRQGLVK